MENLPNYVSFDLEFNTVDDFHHLIQVSAVKFVAHKETESFDSYVHTTVPLKSFINGLTGITKEKVDHAPKVEEVLQSFQEFISDFPLIGYNGEKSDIPVLQQNGLDLSAQYKLDVFDEVKEIKNSELNGILNMKLTTVAQYFGIQGRGHNSLEDARMTALVYEKMLELQENKKYLEKQEEKESNTLGNLFSGVDLSQLFKD